MNRYEAKLLVAIVFSLSVARATAQEHTPVIAPDDGTRIAVGKMSYHLPFTWPTRERVLAALPNDKQQAVPASVTCELVSYALEPERFYPLVGPARLSKAHFRCTVTWAERHKSEVVFIDHDELIIGKAGKR